MSHRHEWVGHEDRGELEEVPLSDRPLGFCARTKQSGIVVQIVVAQQMLQQLGGVGHRFFAEHSGIAEPFGPRRLSEAFVRLLECERQQLLSQQVCWQYGRCGGFDVAAGPQTQQPSGGHERLVRGREEQGVAAGSGPSPRASDALQESSDRRRAVDLDHPVEIADVNAEFQGARRHDHTVAGLGERLLRSSALVLPERAVRHERRHVSCSQRQPEFFHPLAGVDEHQALLAAVQSADHRGRVVE